MEGAGVRRPPFGRGHCGRADGEPLCSQAEDSRASGVYRRGVQGQSESLGVLSDALGQEPTGLRRLDSHRQKAPDTGASHPRVHRTAVGRQKARLEMTLRTVEGQGVISDPQSPKETAMGRISRSFQLVGQSYRILMQDKELMILPLISGIFIIVAVAAMALGFGLSPSHLQRRGPELYIPIFLFYVVTYAIGIFFQAAVVA